MCRKLHRRLREIGEGIPDSHVNDHLARPRFASFERRRCLRLPNFPETPPNGYSAAFIISAESCEGLRLHHSGLGAIMWSCTTADNRSGFRKVCSYIPVAPR